MADPNYSNIPDEKYKHFAKFYAEAYNAGEKMRVKEYVPNDSYLYFTVHVMHAWLELKSFTPNHVGCLDNVVTRILQTRLKLRKYGSSIFVSAIMRTQMRFLVKIERRRM